MIWNAAYYISDQYTNYYKAFEIYAGYINTLEFMILFSYPSSIVIMRDYSNCSKNSCYIPAAVA